MATALILCVLIGTQAQEGRGVGIAEKEIAGVRLTLSQLSIDANKLALSYEIRNGSNRDIWLCAAIDWLHDFEVCLAEDAETLTIRRRLDVPTTSMFYGPPTGTYVRMLQGQSRVESLQLPLPIREASLFCSAPLPLQNVVHARKLAIELGFYDYDVATMVLDMIDKAERVPKPVRGTGILFWLGGPRVFTISNERVRDRDQEVRLSYSGQGVKPEQVLRVVAEDVKIPCAGPHTTQTWISPPAPPDLTDCTRVTVTYQPSMLDYFFPSRSQQSLLSVEERRHLQQQKTVVVDDPSHIKAFGNEIGRGRSVGIAMMGSTARVESYQGDRVLASFTLYGDQRLVMGDGQQFRYADPIEGPRAFTEGLRPFELRSRCAANLKNLWYRLRLYYRSKGAYLVDPSVTPKYPPADKWSDDIVAAYEDVLSQEELLKPFRCPAVAEGRAHYAMNPNCLYDSPPETVLLFETTPGWNQHGGRELFTFDDHDPKGGLVLLNDGKVKFIRTQEGLMQLRWK